MQLPRLCSCLVAVVTCTTLLPANPKVGVLLKDRDLFWAAVQDGVVEASQAAKLDPIIKAPLNANMLGQQLTLLSALEKEPSLDALVIGPLTIDDFKAPLASFVKRGVKIVALDTPLPAGIAHTFIGYNQKAMAEAAARYFASLIQDTDEVAMLRANSLETVSVREKSFLATFKELQPKATMHLDVMSGAKKGDDYDQSILLLASHPKIKAVLTPFSAGSMAMIKALNDKKLAGKVQQVGFGVGLPPAVVEAIEAGTLIGWVAQQPKLIGVRGIEAAADLIQNKPVPATIDVDYFIVTKANLNEPKIQELRK